MFFIGPLSEVPGRQDPKLVGHIDCTRGSIRLDPHVIFGHQVGISVMMNRLVKGFVISNIHTPCTPANNTFEVFAAEECACTTTTKLAVSIRTDNRVGDQVVSGGTNCQAFGIRFIDRRNEVLFRFEDPFSPQILGTFDAHITVNNLDIDRLVRFAPDNQAIVSSVLQLRSESSAHIALEDRSGMW